MKLYMPVLLYNEKGCVKKHGSEMASCGKKALIVTGRNSSRVNGSLKDVKEALEAENTAYAVFDEVEENPSVETVMKARDMGIKERVDFVIGVGGGSPMDASKAIALMIANPDKGEEVLYRKESLEALPVVAVPTTAGTGSEVTPYAILTVHKEKTKKSISHRIFPVLSLADATYLQTGSEQGTLNTAVDTLAHLVESYLNTNSDSCNRMYSERGLAVWGGVRKALEAREFSEEVYEKLLEACILGGMAISHTGTSLPHGLSYKITYELGVPHGKAVGIFLAGYVKCYSQQGKEDACRVLELLGFESFEEFGAYLDGLLGTVELTEEILRKNAQEIQSNKAKLSNYPFVVNEEQLFKMKMY